VQQLQQQQQVYTDRCAERVLRLCSGPTTAPAAQAVELAVVFCLYQVERVELLDQRLLVVT